MGINQKHVELIYEAAGSDEAEVCAFVENLRDDALRSVLKDALKQQRVRLMRKLSALDKIAAPPVENVSVHTGPPVEGD